MTRELPTGDVKASFNDAALQARGRLEYEEDFREQLELLRDEVVASGAPASVEWIFFTAPDRAWRNDCGTEGWLLIDPENLRQYRYLEITMS